MNYPLVSIIIPSYNHEQYVVGALDSVLADTYPNKEIVIINDGSKDNSDYIINAWIAANNTKITVQYLNRENRGVTATLNQLVELSSGKYVVLLASDDALFGDTIAERVEILENNEPSGKLVLVSDALVIDTYDKVILQSSMTEHNRGNKLKYADDIGIMKETLLNPSISGATVMINKKIYDLVGKYPEDLLAEDWFFFQRAAALKAILFWDKPVSLYRVHINNTSGLAAPINRQIALNRSIVKTYRRNFNRFPLAKFKMIALMQLLKYMRIAAKLRVQKMLGKK